MLKQLGNSQQLGGTLKKGVKAERKPKFVS